MLPRSASSSTVEYISNLNNLVLNGTPHMLEHACIQHKEMVTYLSPHPPQSPQATRCVQAPSSEVEQKSGWMLQEGLPEVREASQCSPINYPVVSRPRHSHQVRWHHLSSAIVHRCFLRGVMEEDLFQVSMKSHVFKADLKLHKGRCV